MKEDLSLLKEDLSLLKEDLSRLSTEKTNENTINIDKLSTLEMVKLINSEDKKVALAVEREAVKIAEAIDAAAFALQNGGRIIYIGAGTSGRLGILDASECVPTFGVSSDTVLGLIAGGETAVRNPVEGAEDSEQSAVADLNSVSLSARDIVIGIAASGRTPYVIGGLLHAAQLGAKTVAIACVKGSKIGAVADISIEAEVGPEVIAGSTRMKSGTAQKMILNMLSTGAMVKIGKVYNNLMVDLRPLNQKLIERVKKIVCEATGKSRDEAEKVLEATGFDAKKSIFILKTCASPEAATCYLEKNSGVLSAAMSQFEADKRGQSC